MINAKLNELNNKFLHIIKTRLSLMWTFQSPTKILIPLVLMEIEETLFPLVLTETKETYLGFQLDHQEPTIGFYRAHQ